VLAGRSFPVPRRDQSARTGPDYPARAPLPRASGSPRFAAQFEDSRTGEPSVFRAASNAAQSPVPRHTPEPQQQVDEYLGRIRTDRFGSLPPLFAEVRQSALHIVACQDGQVNAVIRY